MDSVTTSKQRLAYAKVCVEISVDTKLPRSIKVLLRNGSSAWVGVDIPWLPPKCSNCAIFGHSAKACSRKVQSTEGGFGEPGKSRKVKSKVVDEAQSSTDVDLLPLKAVAVTPFPPGVEIAKGGIRGSTNQFVVLAEAAALVLKDVDRVGASSIVSEVVVDVPVVSPVVQQEVSANVDAEVVLASAQLPVETGDQLVEQQVFVVESVVNGVEPVVPRKTRAAVLGVARLVQDMKSKKKDQVGKAKKKAHVVAKRRELEAAQLVNLSSNINSSSIGRVRELRDELLQLEIAERSFYQQRAKVQWPCESDQSTKYFHSMVKVKNRKQAITSLISEAGLKLNNQEEIATEVVQVFSRLLGASDPNVFVHSVGTLEELISSSLYDGEADSLIREGEDANAAGARLAALG
ncbi:hypothetical protein V6N13_129171 [Hibiscus sabdariffa]